MKILFGLHNVEHTEIAQSEIDAFKKSGFETASSAYGNWASNKNVFNGLKILFKNAFELKKIAKKQQSDIVYLNTALDFKTLVRDSITIFILKRFNKKLKIVLKFHGSESSYVLSKYNLLKNYIFRKANLLLVLSAEERNNFLSGGVPAEKVQITANVIQKDLYQRDPDFKKNHKLSEEINVLLFVGRFIPEKGILDLVEACKLLREDKIKFHLFCLGNGPLYEEVSGFIKIHSLEENITLSGHIPESETRKFYANCEILILPTYHEEGFPMAVFQAVGAGKPVITTRIRAAADYLTEFENCLWVEKKNPGQVYQQIRKLVNDKKLQEKINRNNLELAEKFTAENIVIRLQEYFKKI